jgi:hypothetical protein
MQWFSNISRGYRFPLKMNGFLSVCCEGFSEHGACVGSPEAGMGLVDDETFVPPRS